MPIDKELKKFTRKFPREIGRIVMQAGRAIEDATDLTNVIQAGEAVKKEGLIMMERAKQKLAEKEKDNVATICEPSSNTSSNNNISDNVSTLEQPSSYQKFNSSTEEPCGNANLPKNDEVISIISEEYPHGSVEDINDSQLETISISSRRSSTSTILIQRNLELEEKIKKLEAQLKAIKQEHESQPNFNVDPSNLHLVLKLRQ